MMGHPILSIIVPVYNVEPYLALCINSILSSTFQNFELILVNDGSTDSSGNICDKFKNLDGRIIVYHQKNKGVSSARNEGLRIARGEYITFIDSDDEIEPRMFEILFNNARKYNCDISCCRLDVIDTKGQLKLIDINGSRLYSSEELIQGYFEDPAIKEFLYGPVNKLFKREILIGKTFSNYKIGEDILFIFDVLQNTERIYIDKFVGYHYIHRTDSAMHSPFSLKRLDYIYAGQKIVEICKSQAPYALSQANVWLFRHIIVTLRQIFAHRLQHDKNYVDFVNQNLIFVRQNRILLKYLAFKRKLDYYILVTFPSLFRFYK